MGFIKIYKFIKGTPDIFDPFGTFQITLHDL